MATVAVSLGTPSSDLIIEQSQEVCIKLPTAPLASQSLQIAPLSNQSLLNWSPREHAESFRAMQKTAQVWKEKKIGDQYLVYGKQSIGASSPFQWEIVPYSQSTTWLHRFFQQFKVLWKITFGGTLLRKQEIENQLANYKTWFSKFSSPHNPSIPAPSTDAFCNPQVIQKQRVLEGQTVNLLYNYKPIGFGGERLHFLVVPKAHKASFHELSEEEYVEAMKFTQQVITHLSKTRQLQEVYLYHKTGVDAGQTVPHWHLHIVLTANKAQDIFGKLTVLKNMVIDSSPLKEKELQEKVLAYQHEFKKVD